MSLGNADWEVTHTPLFEQGNLLLCFEAELHRACTINLLGNLLDLGHKAIFEVVCKVERRRRLIFDKLHSRLCQLLRSCTTLHIGVVDYATNTHLGAVLHNEGNLLVGIARKAVEANQNGLTKLLQVCNMAVEVSKASLQTLCIWQLNLLLIHTTVHLQRQSRSHKHGQIWLQARLTALDIEELLGTKVSTKARLCDGIVRPRHSHTGCNNRVTAVCDIRKWASVNNHWMVLGCLHEVWIDSILQECYNRSRNTQVLNCKWSIIVAHTQNDAADASIQVVDIACKAQDSHNLRCWSDVEASFGWNTIYRASQARYNMAQRTIVDIEHSTPHNLLQTHLLRAIVVEVVVEQGCDKVICRGNSVEVASEVEVDILRRQHLCITATSSTTLHTEARSQRRLSQSNHCSLADMVESHTQADAYGGLTYTSLSRCDSGNQDKVALFYLLLVDKFVRNFCNVLTVIKDLLLGKAHLCCNLSNILQFD